MSNKLFEMADSLLGEVQMGVNFWLPSGILGLDLIVSEGKGIPGGKMVEVYGDAASGKTALCLSLARQMQKRGGTVVWLDAEAGLSVSLAKNLIRVDLDNNFIYKMPDTLEDAIEAIEKIGVHAASNDIPTLIVLDSIAALQTKTQSIDSDKDFTGIKRVMGSAANVISWFGSRGILRKIAGSKVVLVIVNQTRTNLVMKPGFFTGPTQTTPGGKAISFYSRLRLEVSKKDLKKDIGGKSTVIGRLIKIKTVKNSFGPENQVTYIPFYPSRKEAAAAKEDVYGMSDAHAQLNYLISRKAIKIKGGGWIEIAGSSKRKNEWATAIEESVDLAKSIRDLVVAEYYNEHRISQE